MGYTASEEALLTILLHAAKFPSCTVNGLLLGKGAGSDAQITHSIPLFHTVSLTLAPCVETALDQVGARDLGGHAILPCVPARAPLRNTPRPRGPALPCPAPPPGPRWTS